MLWLPIGQIGRQGGKAFSVWLTPSMNLEGPSPMGQVPVMVTTMVTDMGMDMAENENLFHNCNVGFVRVVFNALNFLMCLWFGCDFL